jgi:diguanylate cyclase (GGDEF)-like protein/PAS domain S-box-containing protein
MSDTMATLRASTHQLQSGHDFLHAIVDGVPEALAVIDGDGFIVMVNRAWRQYSIDNSPEPGGPARNTEVGASYFDVCRASRGPGSEGSEAALEGIRSVMDGRLSSFTLEYPCHSPRENRWFSMRVAPLVGCGGRGAVIAHVDITSNKRAEAALAESEERWKFALEGTGEGVWDWNLQTGKALFSRRWKEMFGYSEGDIGDAASEWESRVHPDDLPGVMERIHEHLDGKTPIATSEFRMRCRDGSWRWTLGRGKLVSRGPDGQPLRIVGTNVDITERKSMEEQLHLLAFYDTLTLLPNRRLLDNRLGQALAACRRTRCFGALMFLDLDNFKTVNDRHGHAVGDLLLIEAARRLKSCIRETDTAARFGGDEFTLMIGPMDTGLPVARGLAHSIAEKVRNRLLEPFVLTVRAEGQPDHIVEHRCSACIGVTLFSGLDENPGEVLRRADRAMYQAKTKSRDSIEFT